MNAWQTIVISASLVGIFVWSIWLLKNKRIWGYAIAPLSYLSHTLLLYLFLRFGHLPVVFINGWSHAVRLHGIILLIAAGIIMMVYRSDRTWTSQ